MVPPSILSSLISIASLLWLSIDSTQPLPPSSPRKSINFGPQHHSEPLLQTSIFSSAPHADRAQAERLIQLFAFNSGPTVSHFTRTASIASTADDVSELKQLGIQIATEFISQTHSAATFKLTSAYVSKHTNVLHCNFVQTISLGTGTELGPVSNALANFNVDLNPRSKSFGHILSYSDSFHPLSHRQDRIEAHAGHPINPHHFTELIKESTETHHPNQACKQLQTKLANALDAAAEGSLNFGDHSQQVLSLISSPTSLSSLGQSLLSQFTESELVEIASCHLSPEVSSPGNLDHSGHREAASNVVDPRVALVSFLTMVADETTEVHLRSKSIDDIVNSIEVVTQHHLQSAAIPFVAQFLNVPGALESVAPTTAELAWLSVDHPHTTGTRELQLVWRFEYRSKSNWYESYVDATRPGLVPMVVDWVKDFRPTT